MSALTLLVDRLVPPDEVWPAMPALQQLLSKGERGGLAGDYYAALCGLFGYPGSRETLPLAPLSALGDGLDPTEGWWLCADPVHMVADRDQLYLSAHQTLEVTQTEADALAAELNRIYAGEGWQFIVAVPGRWYLRLPKPLRMRTTPTGVAMGSPVGEVLPRGEDALAWQRVMTEIQMVLHTSQVNAERSAEGRLTINSLWFWGGGALPEVDAAPAWQRVMAEEPLALGLAKLYGIPGDSAAASVGTSGGRTLQVCGGDSLAEVEEGVFAPALERLRGGELQEMDLLLPGYGRWRVGRRALCRWWRWRKPLEKLLGVTE